MMTAVILCVFIFLLFMHARQAFSIILWQRVFYSKFTGVFIYVTFVYVFKVFENSF